MTTASDTNLPFYTKDVFYIPEKDGCPPQGIDEVVICRDGVKRGVYSRRTAEELSERHNGQVLITTTKDFREMEEAFYKSEPEEIDRDAYFSALQCLPPLGWERFCGVESFKFSEFKTGRITTIYATFDGRYWKFLDLADLAPSAVALRILNHIKEKA
ncbi:DUF1419 domain-containing protein [Hydrogenophaga sp. NFH-34]|uniref:DUF1419 domain-containing protein n=1 Tax=Hydrogenophaga sp. NFH-34 TaxID=2744446 RepID=UPI001F2A78C2|nr:DUF1419 domain-containing protein [Hydrogenophaga sp. NFH-34]